MAESSGPPRSLHDGAEQAVARSPPHPPENTETHPLGGVNGDATRHPEKRVSEDNDWDGGWDDEDEEDDEDEALVLEDDPEELATWSGHASVKGSSEIIRMLLLNFNAIGMTCAPKSTLPLPDPS